MDLTLDVREAGRFTIVEVGGEVDVYTSPRLRERAVEAVDAGARDLVVDLRKVEFLDSTGLGALVAVLKRVRGREGTLRLVCSRDDILKIFRITGLDKVLPIHDSLDEATRQG